MGECGYLRIHGTPRIALYPAVLLRKFESAGTRLVIDVERIPLRHQRLEFVLLFPRSALSRGWCIVLRLAEVAQIEFPPHYVCVAVGLPARE